LKHGGKEAEEIAKIAEIAKHCQNLKPAIDSANRKRTEVLLL